MNAQQVPLPILLEDGSRHDWQDAAYSPKVSASGGRATVEHRLQDAPVLGKLIDDKAAAWAVEVRCPKTLMARVDTSFENPQEIRWRADEVDDAVYIVPGVIALRELSLDNSALTSLWADAGVLRVPPGWWLVKGDARRAKTLTESLLKFLRDETLAEGRMEIGPDRGSGRLRFTVKMAPELFERARSSRNVQIAALVGACSWFPRVFKTASASSGGDGDGHGDGDSDGEPIDEDPLAQELRYQLTNTKSDVVLWDDDNFDPALVATLLEPFHATAAADDDE